MEDNVMLHLADLNKNVCRNDFRVVGYRNGHMEINIPYGDDVQAAKHKYDELSGRKVDLRLSSVVLFNFNQPVMR
jgi:hypothetical protein